ncbi:MAG: NAD-dependent epimerase/dehydratase family protein [Gammaproteobacteria bacterium]|nr:NAD-dependent epimerase/dehydratase family protein [Gammaproteobacteria bacterium]
MNSFWDGRTALVTGAGGFTGRHLATELKRRGAKVRAFIREGSSSDFESAIEIFSGDLLSDDDCHRAMQGMDTIFHVAAVFRRVSTTTEELRRIHVNATEHLLRAAKEAGARRFVHTSTIGVHGGLKVDRADEQGEFSPSDDYQLTKLEGEQLVSRLAPELGVPYSIIRPCAIYGPGDTRFLKFIKPISRGMFVMVGPGEVHGHFVYIDDLVEGFLLAGEKEEACGETFIIGGMRSHSLNEFARTVADICDVRRSGIRVPVWPVYAASVVCEKICKLIGVEPPLHPRRVAFFTKHRSFSIAKARRLLGYEPKTDLETGMRRLILWFRQQGYMHTILVLVGM